MWKARKIELIPNAEFKHLNMFYYEECYTLKINDVYISNTIDPVRLTIDDLSEIQDMVCTFCGAQGCNGGDIFMARRHGNSILMIPCFDYMEMDEWLQYDFTEDDAGYAVTPPDKWYKDGILVIGEDMLPTLFKLLPGLKMEDIFPLTDNEKKLVFEWELRVYAQPKEGFRRERHKLED